MWQIVPTSNSSVTDNDLRALAVLLGPSLVRALDLVQSQAVTAIKAVPSGRRVWRVAGSGKHRSHTVLGLHYCDCPAFQFEVLSRGEALYVRVTATVAGHHPATQCKHQLAVRLAQALSQHREESVPDAILAAQLLERE